MIRNTDYSDIRSRIRHAIGRHRGGHSHGHSPFGHGRGGGDGDFSRFGRKLSADELHLVLLALLAEQPAHGYELIRTLEAKSGGFYSPSSGMIYPALTYLDEIGHTASVAEANRKLYSITEAGAAHLAERRTEADAILAALSRIGGRMEEVRDAFAGVGDASTDDTLHAARHALKHALRRKFAAGPEEARRIAAILVRATAEILGKD